MRKTPRARCCYCLVCPLGITGDHTWLRGVLLKYLFHKSLKWFAIERCPQIMKRHRYELLMARNKVPGRFASEKGVATTEERNFPLQSSAEQSEVVLMQIAKKCVSKRLQDSIGADYSDGKRRGEHGSGGLLYPAVSRQAAQITSCSLFPVTRAQDSAA